MTDSSSTVRESSIKTPLRLPILSRKSGLLPPEYEGLPSRASQTGDLTLDVWPPAGLTLHSKVRFFDPCGDKLEHNICYLKSSNEGFVYVLKAYDVQCVGKGPKEYATINSRMEQHLKDNPWRDKEVREVLSLAGFWRNILSDCIAPHMSENRRSVIFFSEYLDSGDLWDFVSLTRDSPVIPSPVVATNLLDQLLPVLNYLHKINIVHGDISLENILLRMRTGRKRPTTYNGFDLVLIDFCRATTRFNTISYLAYGKELYREPAAEPVDDNRSADLYALGVCAKSVITSRVPYFSDHVQDVLVDLPPTRLKSVVTALLSPSLTVRDAIAAQYGSAYRTRRKQQRKRKRPNSAKNKVSVSKYDRPMRTLTPKKPYGTSEASTSAGSMAVDPTP